MSIYRFGRFCALLREDGMPVYAGRVRISKPPRIVWWWPVNWVVLPVLGAWVLACWGIERLRGLG